MANIKNIIDEYKQNAKQVYYLLNEEELIERFKEENIINDEGFIITTENEDENIVIPFDESWLYFTAVVEKDKLLAWVALFNEEHQKITEYPFSNDFYNFLLIKYRRVLNKEVFDLFVDKPEEFIEKIFKYKDSFKLLKKLRGDIKYSDDRSFAGDPGKLILSDEKYEKIAQILNLNNYDLKVFNKKKKLIKEHIKYGDTQPAIVVSVDPLIISSYTDEIDCVVMLKYPNEFVSIYDLKIGDRLVTVNQYYPKLNFNYAPDLIPGEHASKYWRDVIPVVGLFVCENEEYCKRKVRLFESKDWDILQEKTINYLKEKPNVSRNGFRYFITK